MISPRARAPGAVACGLACVLALPGAAPGAVPEETRKTNREVVHAMLNHLDLDDSWIRMVDDRPGHDRRYAIAGDKARDELGWKPQHHFDEALAHTLDWYRKNRHWWQPIKDGDFQAYYDKQYA